MRLGVLFSGGKDSTLALHKVVENNQQVKCLITLRSKNPESYMFHTPNVNLTNLQAQALNLPLIVQETLGKKEEELIDLEKAITQAVNQFEIEGIVTGAIESVYQSKRIENICNSLSLSCFNPLWKKNQQVLLEELLEKQFKVIICGIFAYPLNKSFLGKLIDRTVIDKLIELQHKYGISPAGEGGEIETTVLDAPLFSKRIEIIESEIFSRENEGVFKILQAKLILK
ncbi:MAG: TIGR00289 family protein [Crenarchaeota archaeon]|nr:TIGR00289 family protein [Thermoproteota archaeon]